MSNENTPFSAQARCPILIKKRSQGKILDKIENIKMSRNYEAIQEFLTISKILEIHEYKTSFKKKLIKIISEDLSGIVINTIFEKEFNTTEKNLIETGRKPIES